MALGKFVRKYFIWIAAWKHILILVTGELNKSERHRPFQNKI